MRVYNINKAIGLASSGVEYAQKYRRQLLADIAWVEDYYVFTDYISTNLSFYSDRLDFSKKQVLWIYNLVTGRQTTGCALSVAEFVATIKQPHLSPQIFPDYTDIVLVDSAVRYRIRTLPVQNATPEQNSALGYTVPEQSTTPGYTVPDQSTVPDLATNHTVPGRRSGANHPPGTPLVDRVETLVGDQLVRVEHYDETLNNVEHFHQNQLVRRVFYTPDGRVGAEQFYRDREITRTLIKPASPLYDHTLRQGRTRQSSFQGDVVLEGRSQFFQYVFRHLFSQPDDVVIVDRALDVIDAIYPVIGNHRLYSVVHAEHFDLKQIEDGVLLWNNHYENVFTRPDMIDGFIVSTRRQQIVLKNQLATRFPTSNFNVVCIPVGFATLPDTDTEAPLLEPSAGSEDNPLPESDLIPLPESDLIAHDPSPDSPQLHPQTPHNSVPGLDPGRCKANPVHMRSAPVLRPGLDVADRQPPTPTAHPGHSTTHTEVNEYLSFWAHPRIQSNPQTFRPDSATEDELRAGKPPSLTAQAKCGATQSKELHSLTLSQTTETGSGVCSVQPTVAYDRFAIVTASRLAEEKHIDILIRAVSAVRKTLPALRLDIYGEGNRDKLLAVIKETQSQDYVRLMGHRNLHGVLGSYGLYVSTSWSEGFGLSLLEAMSAGLPLVGFDVDYGNREMIESGSNGQLVPCTFTDGDVTAIADAIVATLTSDSFSDMRSQSLRKAADYTAPHVRALWERLLSEEGSC